MSAELSGSVVSLSGRINTLEGQILALPTNADFGIYAALINGSLNTLETVDTTQTANIDLLLQNFANLKDTILNIDSLLDTHTGLATGVGGAHESA